MYPSSVWCILYIYYILQHRSGETKLLPFNAIFL